MQQLDLLTTYTAQRGITFHYNKACCTPCGWSELPPHQHQSAAFITQQQYRKLLTTGQAYMDWNCDIDALLGSITRAGLTAERPSSTADRILIKRQ